MGITPRPVLLLLSLALTSLACKTPPLIPQNIAQQNSSSNAAPAHSPYEGRPISDPEALSGVWEASDGHGSVFGIDLRLQTYRRGKALAPLHGETWESLDVGLFKTSSPSPLFGEEFFAGDMQPDGLRYDHGHLVLHNDTSDLDLSLQPDGNWLGRFHSGPLDTTVTLVQFGPRSGKPSGLLGTWRSGAADLYTCLHIAEPVPGSITAWQDQHQNNDVMHFAPQIPRPSLSLESYGGRFSVRPAAADRGLLLETPPSLAACCAHASRASVRHGILSLSPGPDPMPAWSLNSTRWDRMPGNTCAPPPPPPAASVPRLDRITAPPPHAHPVSLARPAISPPPPPRTPPCLPSPVQ